MPSSGSVRHRITAFAELVRAHYPLIIISAVIAGLTLGLWTTAPGQLVQSYSQPLTFLMILFISFTITPQQFALVTRQPRAVLLGLFLNFGFMPFLCWALARSLVSDPNLATGIILVGVVPCAGMAAVWTALLKGDVPLGMAINALTMALGPFLIPLLMGGLAGTSVDMDSFAMFRQLAVILLVPLALALVARWRAERRWDVKPFLPVSPAFSALIAVVLMFAICNVNVPLMVARSSQVPALLVAVFLVFPLGFAVSHWLSGSGFDPKQRIALTYSAGMKNLPIAVGLAFAGFSQSTGLPVALAMIAQMLTASLVYQLLRRTAAKQQPTAAYVKG